MLCGRATWAGAVDVFKHQGVEAAQAWVLSEGKANIQALNEVLAQTAVPVKF